MSTSTRHMGLQPWHQRHSHDGKSGPLGHRDVERLPLLRTSTTTLSRMDSCEVDHHPCRQSRTSLRSISVYLQAHQPSLIQQQPALIESSRMTIPWIFKVILRTILWLHEQR